MSRTKIIDMYKYCVDNNNTPLLPPLTNETENPAWYDFWANTYDTSGDTYKAYDREFARRYADFEYEDFLDATGMSNIITNFHSDITSLLQLNQKKYQEMYRIFLLTDEEMPVTYNYDMTETTGKQKTTFDKGQQQDTIGQRQDTIGEITDTHKVAPFNSNNAQVESSDTTSSHTDTIGQHTDTYGTRKDTTESDEWTLTRKGNIGTQTAADVANSFVKFFDNNFKFMLMIFEDIVKQMLYIGD